MKYQRKLQVAVMLLATLIGMFIERASAQQPHMQAARTHLQGARTELKHAEADKAGHRAKALSLVNEALKEVQAGIKAGRK